MSAAVSYTSTNDKYRDCHAACSTFRCRSLLSSSGFICSY